MRFQLIDNVISRDDQQIVAVKNVTNAEEYLQDHFPSFPVLPGVMMLETMVQAARILLADHPDAGEGPWTLAEVRNLRYGQMVRPSQQLCVTVQLRKVEPGLFSFQGSGEVNGKQAVTGRFTMRPVAVKV